MDPHTLYIHTLLGNPLVGHSIMGGGWWSDRYHDVKKSLSKTAAHVLTKAKNIAREAIPVVGDFLKSTAKSGLNSLTNSLSEGNSLKQAFENALDSTKAAAMENKNVLAKDLVGVARKETGLGLVRRPKI